MNLRSSWVAETGQTREDTRLTQTGVTTMSNPVQVRSGILPGSYDGAFRLAGFWTFGSGAMTATVSEGRAVIQGDITQGAYPVTLPAAASVTFTPGNAQYGRIDVIVLKIYDTLYDSSTKTEAKLEIIQGTPEQTPKVPLIPARCLPLYEVVVPAGVSAGNGGIPWNTSLKDLRSTVVSLGGILPAEGATGPGTYPGQYQDAANTLQRWDGSKWVPYPAALGGIMPNTASATPASYTGQYRDTATGQLQRWNGSAWIPAVPVGAFVDNGDYGDTTSVTYTSTLAGRVTNPLTVSFVAPPSRAVAVSFGAKMRSTSNDHYAYMALKLTQGATVVNDLDDDYAVIAATQNMISASNIRRYSGLTAGATYTLTAFFRVITNTLTLKAGFDNTFIKVDPLP
ncbi:hypothetical protein AB0F25_06990 [Streptomyces wedmorensis]|uniref:hypothetical protein n=1 Tax=Streptomyces wedmorensis TaxID=43759 RepID=UPI0034206988